jgi:cation transport regulator ChaC
MRATSFGRVWRDQALSKEILYFGYGSNLSQEDLDDWKKGNPKYAHLDLKLKKFSIGFLAGYRLGFTRKSNSERRGFMGVADIVKTDEEPQSRVWGVIFSLNACQGQAIADKEGNPFAYRQIWVEVTDKDGAMHSCLTYEAVVENDKMRKCLYHRPSERYCEVIRKGGEEHGLPQEFFEHLRVASVTERNRVPMENKNW